MPKVVITTEPLQHAPGPHLALLREAGFEVVYPREALITTENDTIAAVGDAVAVIAGSEPYTAQVLERLPQLRVIARNGVGYDRIDVPAATRLGIAVTITPEGNHAAVAEHVLALLLGLARAIKPSDAATRQGLWRRQEPLVPLRGKTLGIVGLGRIGRSVALRAKGFGLRILAYETQPDQRFVAAQGVQLVDLETLLAEADFVTLHVPLTAETRGLINARTLARMQRGSFLINTARGGLVVEEDLFAALRSGQLAGAGLDVFASEPPPADHPLFTLDNVLATPHVAALDTQALEDMSVAAARSIVELKNGGWPSDQLVNPLVKETWQWSR